jgi:Zn-dependent metalloprotease
VVAASAGGAQPLDEASGQFERAPAYRAFELGANLGRFARFLETGRLEAADELRRTAGDPVARSAAVAHADVAAHFERQFGLRGIDQSGAPLVAVLHPVPLRTDAGMARFATGAWYAGSGVIIYGDGDGGAVRPAGAARDVVAHQAAYAILDASAGLAEFGEGVALADGFADVLAAAIDLAADEAHPWTVGERVASPASTLLGSRLGQVFFLSVTGDSGGSSAALRERASRMERIFYRAFVFHLGPGATMEMAAAATLQAAADLYSAESADWLRLRRAWQQAGVM